MVHLPLSLVLVLFQTLHGSLLQAQHIARLDFSASEIRALAPPPASLPGGATTGDGAPLVVHHDSPASSALVSEDRRAEIMNRAAAEQYHFHPAEAGRFAAANPSQRLDLLHGADGFTATPRPDPVGALVRPAADPAWSIRLQTTAIRFDGTSIPLDRTPSTPSVMENQSSRDLADGTGEWFINRSTGIEHGYTIQEPRAVRPGSIQIRITAHTALAAALVHPGAIEFRNRHDTTVAVYRDLHVYDQRGHEQPSTMTLDGSTIVLTTDVRDAEFPVTVDPVLATQQGNSRMAGDGAPGDGFGAASAGHGDFTAIGAPQRGSGKVYIQHRNQGGAEAWGEHSSVEVPATESPGAGDGFGSALAMGEDEATGSLYLAVGAPGHGGCGAVFLFIYALGVWTYLQKLAPTTLTTGARFGGALAMFGVMLAVGARAQLGHGAVFLFALGLALFSLVQTILSPARVPGNDFGAAVALFGTFLLIGAPGETQGGFARAGAAYLFTALVAGALFPLGYSRFFSAHPAAGDELGSAVAANNDSIAISAPRANGWPGNFIENAGLVLIFGLVAGSWGHRASLFGTIAGGLFGYALSMNFFGDIAIGSPGARTTASVVAGLVFLYLFNPLTLTYGSGQKIIPTTYIDPGMFLGASVLLLGTLLFAMATRYNANQGAFFLFLLAATAISFANWQLLFWSQSMVNNPAMQHIVGPTADPDGDRLPNFLEYILYLVPTVFNRSPLSPLLTSGGLFRLVFPLSLTVLNAVLILQYSLNFALWDPVLTGPLAAFFSLTVLHPGIQANIMVLTLAIAAAGLPHFHFRYRAEERL